MVPVFEKYQIREAILLGSFAKGNAHAESDVDLLVDSGLTGLRFVGFMEAVRRAVERPVDVLDVIHIEKNSRIDREIQASGIKIYDWKLWDPDCTRVTPEEEAAIAEAENPGSSPKRISTGTILTEKNN